MTNRRLLGLAISAVAAAAMISTGASALAASGHGPQTNRRAAATAPRAAAAPAAPAAGTVVTQHYSLAASAFAPDGLHNTADDYFNEWDPTTLSNQDSGRCFNAGLSLPPNAKLKSVTVYYTEGTSAMYFEINEQDLVTHTASELIDFDTATAATPTYASSVETFPKGTAVNMSVNAYSAGVCPSGNATFSGLTITYTQPG